MYKLILAAGLLLSACLNSSAQTYPDGTLIFSKKKGLVGKIAQRMSGDEWTHVAIIFNDRVYEADWPRYKSTHVNSYGKRRSTNDYYVPNQPYTPNQIRAMKQYAVSQMGQRYSLKGYKRGRYQGRGGSTWCSPFVGETLKSGGVQLSFHQIYEPQNLKAAMAQRYSFLHRIRK